MPYLLHEAKITIPSNIRKVSNNFCKIIKNHPPTIDKYRSKEATSASATSF